ncbi:hypothetical protein M409DRAFT_18005 [Zasmidium cellare ATCC 36951]|uniref:Peptidase A1 domain-containing protein n=1 Tax=Zasmidium cellare ATCC 36951 TaxID=1080233 RepID=A0A6A6CXC7_ZASCE|nr:uncharacterized protein M409DRAFT_18005 [Zasmidium cellare ATCC 36951]KAF2171771.1 hypothetical protein M409DRAFT_18005 [Zasmidium cellare ATCC 36951]
MSLHTLTLALLLGAVSATSPSSPSNRKAYTAPLKHISFEGLPEYALDVQLGNKSYPLLFDLGSPVQWLVGSSFQCFDASNKSLPQSQCKFAATFPGNFSEGMRSGPGANFSIGYLDPNGPGRAQGVFGFEALSIAGLSVDHQQLGRVDTVANIQGANGAISGILGVGGSDIANQTLFFFEAARKGLVDPIMSVMLQRQSACSAGEVVFGGLPHTYQGQEGFTTVPFVTKSGSWQTYRFHLDAVKVGDEVFPEQGNATAGIDSGLPLILVANETAARINAQFSPPAQFDPHAVFYAKQWKVDCDAKTPDFAATINGTDFRMNALDQIITFEDDPHACYSVFTNTSVSSTTLLGNAFLRNVLLAIDVEKHELHWAPHVDYH